MFESYSGIERQILDAVEKEYREHAVCPARIVLSPPEASRFFYEMEDIAPTLMPPWGIGNNSGKTFYSTPFGSVEISGPADCKYCGAPIRGGMICSHCKRIG
jgi:hypothetical protein